MNPQSWNEYAYVNGTPMEATDPLGLSSTIVCTTFDGVTNCIETPDLGDPGPGGAGSCSFWGRLYGTCGQPPTQQQCSQEGIYHFANCIWGQPPAPVAAPPIITKPPRSTLACAENFADRYSIAGALHAAGIGDSGGIGGFLTNALGGNAVVGAINAVWHGSSAADLAFSGPGLGVIPHRGGLSDAITGGVAGAAWKVATGAGETIQTINGAASIASTSLSAADFASGVGVAKLAYDFLSLAAGAVDCLAH